MSTIRANPTAPIAMPTLAPVLRPLESLEADVSETFVPLAGDDEAVEVEEGSPDLPTGLNDVVEDGLDPKGDVNPPGSGTSDAVVASAVGIGGQAVVKNCVVVGSIAQIMSNSYVFVGSNGDDAVTMAKEVELQSVPFWTHEDGVALKLLARLPYA
jgi:hypothetical protein